VSKNMKTEWSAGRLFLVFLSVISGMAD
jgi:hypothetical protein